MSNRITDHSVVTASPSQSSIFVDAGRGPVEVHLPNGYTPEGGPYPLLLHLHGYNMTPEQLENFLQLIPVAEAAGYIYVDPIGRIDTDGKPYWDANTSCCDIQDPNTDEDSVYLRDLLEIIQAELGNVDPQRTSVMGHSNGGDMALRMACDHSEYLASAISYAGPGYMPENSDDDPTNGEDYCHPTDPIHILTIHGTEDGLVLYEGGVKYFPGTPLHNMPYPGARQTLMIWTTYNHCSFAVDPMVGTADLNFNVGGAETEIYQYPAECHAAGTVEHWKIVGGNHGPFVTDEFRTKVFEFLDSHARNDMWFADKNTMQWAPTSVALSYSLYQGELPLVDTDDDALADDYGICVNDQDADGDNANTQYVSFDLPSPGEGWFYTRGYQDNAPPLGGGRQQGAVGKADVWKHREPSVPCP